MEIFLFDLILQFSKHHNIRNIYRNILAYLLGYIDEKEHQNTISEYKCDNSQLKTWLYAISVEIHRRLYRLEHAIDIKKYRGALFKSYGQAVENIMIFTIDPEKGDFIVTDRKLAEHLDFAQYLLKDRDELLRGEFLGNIDDTERPIYLGVWSVTSTMDLDKKLKIIREGALRLIEIGVKRKKTLAFYRTTYPNHDHDINDNMSLPIGDFANLTDRELWNFTREVDADDNMGGMLVYRD
jgi:hypothetical protein